MSYIKPIDSHSVAIQNSSQDSQKTLDHALSEAVCSGEVEKVREFIEKRADLYQTLINGLNLLHIASGKGHLEVCQLLVENGLDVNSVSKSPLDDPSVQIQIPDEDKIVPYALNLLKREGLKITPLHSAVVENQIAVVKWLLSKGAKGDSRNIIGLAPLYHAFENGYKEIVDLLIKAGTPFNFYLNILCTNNDPRALKLLLSYHPDLRFCDEKGESALHICSYMGFEACAQLLLEAKADVDQRDQKGDTPLHIVAQCGYDGMVRLFIAHKANPLAVNVKTLYTPLMDYRIQKKLTDSLPLIAQPDNGLTDKLIDLKLIGHRFKIKGEPFSSMSHRFALPFTIRSIQEFLRRNENRDNKVLTYALSLMEETLLHLDQPSYFIELAEMRKPMILPLVWPCHAICMATCYGIGFRANRGRGSDLTGQGISVDKITTLEKLPEATALLLQMNRPIDVKEMYKGRKADELTNQIEEQAIQFFGDEIEKLLGMENIGIIKQKEQPTGTCGFIAIQQMVRLGCIMACMQHDKLEKKDIIQAVNEGLRESRSFAAFDRLYCIERLEEMAKDPRIQNLVNIDDIYREIIANNLGASREPLLRKIFAIRPHLLQNSNYLIKAIDHKFISLAKILIDCGAPLHAPEKEYNEDPFLASIIMDQLDLCEYMIDKGANPNVVFPGNQSGLLIALVTSKLSFIDLLLKKGADPHLPWVKDLIILDYVKVIGSDEIKSLFRKYNYL